MEKKQDRKAPSSNEPVNRTKAATQDVLDTRATSLKIDTKWERHYRRLNGLRDYFLHQMGELAQDANEEQPSYSEHMADAGTDSYDRDFALSMLSSNQNALYEIDEALKRIESGTYGVCELTGKPISRERLNAIPWARFTMEAEQKQEQNGMTNRIRLGPLGSLAEGEPAGEDESGESENNEGNP